MKKEYLVAMMEQRPTRKIIQITATGGSRDYYPMLYALCDDGSLWMQIYQGEWMQVSPPPWVVGQTTEDMK